MGFRKMDGTEDCLVEHGDKPGSDKYYNLLFIISGKEETT
jgi:hypothetical protein